MELDAIRLDQLNRYLTGRLTESEKAAFDRDLATNEALRVELEVQRQIRTAYQISHQKALVHAAQASLNAGGQLWKPAPAQPRQSMPQHEISDQGRSIPFQPSRKRHIGWPQYAMAASVVLALGIGWFALRPEPPKRNAPLARKVTPSTLPTTPSEPTTPVAAQTTAIASATRKKTMPAKATDGEVLFATYFTPVLRKRAVAPDPTRLTARPDLPPPERIAADTVAIKLGIALLKRGKTRAAIRELEPTTRCVLPDWQANARWFLALAYLRNNQPRQARVQLQLLTTDSTRLYKAEAGQLLNKMNAQVSGRSEK